MLLLSFVQGLPALNLPIGSTRPSELLAFLCLSALVMRKIANRTSKLLLSTVLDRPLIFFLLVLFASSVLSINLSESDVASRGVFSLHPLRNQPFVRSYTQIVAYLLGIAAFYATTTVLRSREIVIIGLRWWVAGAVFVSLMGIYGVLAVFFNLPFSDLFGVRFSGTSGIPRISVLAFEARHLAIFLAPVIAFLSIASVHRTYIVRPMLQWLSLLVVFLCFLLTLSRSTMVLGAAVFTFIFLVPILVGQRSILSHLGSAIAMAVVIGVTLMLTNLFLVSISSFNLFDVVQIQSASLSDVDNYSNWQQAASYETAWKIFVDNPVLGVGIGNYPFYIATYLPLTSFGDPKGQFDIPSIANNMCLEIMAETGMIGFSAFVVVLFVLLRYGFKAAHRCKDAHWTILISGLLGSFLVVLLSLIWSSAFFIAPVWALMGLLYATAASGMNGESISAVDYLTKGFQIRYGGPKSFHHRPALQFEKD